jgi:hypothetical protein
VRPLGALPRPSRSCRRASGWMVGNYARGCIYGLLRVSVRVDP